MGSFPETYDDVKVCYFMYLHFSEFLAGRRGSIVVRERD